MDLGELLRQWRVEKGEGALSHLKNGFYDEARSLANSPDPYEAKKAREIYEDVLRMRQRKILMAALTQLRGGEAPDGLIEIEKLAYRRIYSVLDGMRDGVVYDDDVEIEDESGLLLGNSADAQTVPEGQGTLIKEAEPVEVPSEEKATEVKESERIETVEVVEETVEPSGEDVPSEEDTPSQEESVKDAVNEVPAKVSDEDELGLRTVKFVRGIPSFIGPDLSTLGPFEDGEEIELDPDVAAILIANGAAMDLDTGDGNADINEDD